MLFDVAVPLFPSFVQPSSSGNIHVDFPTTSENVVILSDLLDTESDFNLLLMCPLQKLKKSYDHRRKFQHEWVAKLPWAKGVLATNVVFHNVTCKVYTTIDKKPCLLVSKWDTLMKHEGRRKAKKDLPKLNVEKREWFNSKSCKQKQNQTLFFTRVPTNVLQHVNKNTHLDPICKLVSNLKSQPMVEYEEISLLFPWCA